MATAGNPRLIHLNNAPSGPVLSAVSPDPPVAAPVRIRHIDSLRAVAAGLVVWLHYAQLLAPRAAPGPAWLGWLQTFPHAFDVGRMGVLIFFAISGFVICRSFSGGFEGGARRFVIRRFCRLYPAFWVSMAAGWLAWRWNGLVFNWPAVAANATMLPEAFGQPYVLGVYWTLEVELLFYGVCLGLFLARRLEQRALLAVGVLVLTWLPRVVKIIGRHQGIRLGIPHTPKVMMLGLAFMLWGALFRLAYDATGGFRRGVLTHGGTWLVAGLCWELIDVPDPNFKWFLLGQGPITAQIVVAAALLVFTLWVACLRVDNRVLTYLGVISYSLYLFHLIPMMLAEHWLTPEGSPWRWFPFWVDFLVCAGATVALAAGVYRWVERPAIALGKRWAGVRRVAAGEPPR